MTAAKTALILFAHGARDARWKEPFTRLANMLQQQAPDTPVHLAFLELMTPSLAEVIAELAQQQVAAAKVVPVFFGQGGHIRRDLPALLEECRSQFPQLALSCAPAVGEDEAVLQAIAAYCLQQTQLD